MRTKTTLTKTENKVLLQIRSHFDICHPRLGDPVINVLLKDKCERLINTSDGRLSLVSTTNVRQRRSSYVCCPLTSVRPLTFAICPLRPMTRMTLSNRLLLATDAENCLSFMKRHGTSEFRDLCSSLAADGILEVRRVVVLSANWPLKRNGRFVRIGSFSLRHITQQAAMRREGHLVRECGRFSRVALCQTF